MFCNQLRICFFLVIYLAVILTRTTSNHVTSCSGDKSSRRACPSSQSEANFKSSCERYSCCWDATTNGVPWCFYSTGGTASTTSSTTTSTTSTVSSTTNAAGPAAVSLEISEILDKANETEPDALLGILERELTTEELSVNAKSIVGQVLNASFSVYEARRNQSSKPTVGSWMDFFTALIRYSSLKTNENAKLFLKSASKVLLNEFNTPFMNESVMPYMILNSMENYVMSLTTFLLGDSYLEEANQVQVLNFPNVNISTCYQDLSRGDCDVISDDVTAFSTSTRNPSFVTSITYSSDLELFSDISFHDTPATLGSFLFSVTSHFDDVVNAESNVSIVFRKLVGKIFTAITM
ncbi:unnamed protein product [Clavelina lepadiformis]|uniref:P-type domain-containing protein n=1 Tax=Clavelina lepadiformis TaxID=159417 RepID=A0ABP0F1T2_CLALP